MDGAGAEASASGRGRNYWPHVFFLLNVAGLAILIGMAWQAWHPSGELALVRHTPSGAIRHDEPDEIVVEFGAPLDPATVDEEAIRLSPAVPGRVDFTRGRILRYRLQEPLRCATRYAIVLAPGLRGLHGERLPEERPEFITERLAVAAVEQARVESDGSVSLALVFSAAVNPEALRENLSLTDDRGVPVEFSLAGAKPDQRLVLHVPAVHRDTLRLELAEGLAGIDGPLGLAAPYRTAIKILTEKDAPPPPAAEGRNDTVYIVPRLRFLGMQARQRGARGIVEIKTNSPLDATRAAAFVSIEPAVAHSFDAWHGGLRISGEFEAGKRYRITLAEGFPAGDAGSLHRRISRSVWFADKHPHLAFAYGGGYLSPAGLLTVPVRSVNVKAAELHVGKLYPENVVEHVLLGDGRFSLSRARRLGQRSLAFAEKPNEEVETLLDLREVAEPAPRGVYALQVRSKAQYWRSDRAVVVVTDLGLSVRLSAERALCWVTSLRTAEPLAGVRVRLFSDKRRPLGEALSDADGVAEIAVPRLGPEEAPALVLAQTDEDTSYLGFARNVRQRPGAGGRAYVREGYEAFVTAERGVYRPGDRVRLTALLRDRRLRCPGGMPVDVVVARPDGREYERKRVMCDAQGRVLAAIALSEGVPSGFYTVTVRLPGKKEAFGAAGFRVADYIPQTLRLALSAPRGPLTATEPLTVTATVEHLFGEPAKGLKLSGRVRHESAGFAPAKWEGFVFGDKRKQHGPERSRLGEAKTDKDGKAVFAVEAPQTTPAATWRTVVEVEAQEEGGRALAERIERTLHPHPFYLGLKLPGIAIHPRETCGFDLVAVTPAGKQYGETVKWTATLYAVTWSNVLRRRDDGRLLYEWTRREREETTLRGSFTGGTQLQLAPQRPGPYRLVVEAENGCAAVRDFHVGGAGGAWVAHDPEEIKITLDRERYAPGDTVEVILQAPFAGTALVCIERETILSRRIVKLEKGKNPLRLAVEASWRPNAYITATLIRPVRAAEDWQPHRASGLARLPVACEDRRLQVAVETVGAVRPAKPARVRIRVRNARDEPVKEAAVVFAAVDQGVLALTGFKPVSPWSFFYAPRRLDVREIDMFGRLAPELARWRLGKEIDPGGGEGAKVAQELARRLNPIAAKRVKTAVLYAGALLTDAEGNAEFECTMPAYIGELRLMAYVAKDDSFGLAETAQPVKSPVMFRASWPRFLAPGDTFDVPVTLFNRTGINGEPALAFECGECLALAEPVPATVNVPAGGEKTVRLRLKARAIGKATPRLTVRLGEESFAESLELPVRPATGFARETEIMRVEPGMETTLRLPDRYLPGTASSRLVVCGHPLAAVSGSLDYLLAYPYGCVEQTASRLLPLIYAHDLARLVRPDAIGAEEVENLLAAGILRLRMMQTYGGGFAMWPGGREAHAWGSLYAVDVLLEARKAGHAVPVDLCESALDYLEKQLPTWCASRDAKGRPDRFAHAAYACYVLSRAQRRPHGWMARMEELLRVSDNEDRSVPVTARCHLAAAFLQSGERKAARGFLASAPESTQRRSRDGSLGSPLRERAILLATLLDIDPQSPRIPVLVQHLKVKLRHPWSGTTQENAFALMALGKYARRSPCDPDARVRVTVAEEDHVFDAVTGKTFTDLAPGASVKIRLEGKSPLFVYRYCEGVPKTGGAAEEDAGIFIRRELIGLDDGLVPRVCEQGALYRVVLSLHADREVNGAVLLDPLPAGFEIENQDLRGTARIGGEENATALRPEHVERRDDRILVFADVPAGESSFSYIVRAVTTGTFTHPAAEVSVMYDPGIYSVHGRGVIRIGKE